MAGVRAVWAPSDAPSHGRRENHAHAHAHAHATTLAQAHGHAAHGHGHGHGHGHAAHGHGHAAHGHGHATTTAAAADMSPTFLFDAPLWADLADPATHAIEYGRASAGRRRWAEA